MVASTSIFPRKGHRGDQLVDAQAGPGERGPMATAASHLASHLASARLRHLGKGIGVLQEQSPEPLEVAVGDAVARRDD